MLLWQVQMLILTVSNCKVIDALNVIKDTLWHQTMYARKLMLYVKHIQKIMAFAHHVIQGTSSQTTNALVHKIFTFLSVSLSVKMENVPNAKTDITFQMMLVLRFQSFVTTTINLMVNVLLVHQDISSKMINVSIQHLALILDVVSIQIHIALNVSKDTFCKIISVHKSIQSVLISITQKVSVKNAIIQHPKDLIALEIQSLLNKSSFLFYYFLPFFYYCLIEII